MSKTYLLLLFCIAASVSAQNYTTYVYKTVGDLKIELDVFVPAVAPPQSGYPVFFAIHGGAWIFGDKEAAFTGDELNETLRRGWVMVSINYRLAPGVLLADQMEDFQDAYDWVRSQLVTIVPINPDLITLFGQSAGGGYVLTAAYKLVPRPTAVISFYPAYTNWTAFPPKAKSNILIVSQAKKLRTPVIATYPFPNLLDKRADLLIEAYKLGQLGWLMTTMDAKLPASQIMALLKDYSATENVDSRFPPTYLAHGLKDRLVTYVQSQQLADELDKHGVPNVLDLVPGADHTFDYNSTLYWDKHVLPAFNWAQQYMGGSAIESVQLANE